MKLPLTMGHENVGEVVAVGPDAEGVKVGDVRLVDPWMGCGECGVCRRGDENLCLKPSKLGVFRQRRLRTHLMVPHPRYLFDIGDLPPERAAPLACSGVTTYSALKKVGPTLTTEPIVIIGAGGLGLMCLALAQGDGRPSAIVVDIDAGKREAAKKAGADGGDRRRRARCRAADHGRDRRRRLGGDRSRRLVGTARLGIDSLIKGGKLHHRRPVRRRHHDVAAAVPDARHDDPGLLRRQPDRDARTARPGEAHRHAAGADRDAPARRRQRVLDDLRAGKIVGRVVLTPA